MLHHGPFDAHPPKLFMVRQKGKKEKRDLPYVLNCGTAIRRSRGNILQVMAILDKEVTIFHKLYNNKTANHN
jgi:hypothetical protein